LLLFAGLAFFALLPLMRRTNTITLDTDWLYRSLAPAAWHQLERLWLALRRIRDTRIQPWWQESLLRQQLHAMLTSRFSARATIGNFVLLTTLVLLSYLVLYLLF
jgi:multicomponent Na+:H+ antiporter subunit D